MEECKCVQIVKDINKKFPDSDWNCDKACHEWQERSGELEDKNIQFDAGADDNYACTCPTCGEWICGWCV